IGSALIILSFSASLNINFFAMIIYGIGFAFTFPSMNKIVADASADVDRGKAYGIFYAFFSLVVVAGSTISGCITEVASISCLCNAINMTAIGVVIAFIDQKNKQVIQISDK